MYQWAETEGSEEPQGGVRPGGETISPQGWERPPSRSLCLVHFSTTDSNGPPVPHPGHLSWALRTLYMLLILLECSPSLFFQLDEFLLIFENSGQCPLLDDTVTVIL